RRRSRGQSVVTLSSCVPWTFMCLDFPFIRGALLSPELSVKAIAARDQIADICSGVRLVGRAAVPVCAADRGHGDRWRAAGGPQPRRDLRPEEEKGLAPDREGAPGTARHADPPLRRKPPGAAGHP